ncbi:hypothetical protein F5148DRAFT_1150354 [Russula earlei]|uniref:Uncharacterized protein n=1 Tax=Russula earlei TaxID=71964 RepID=A0ACC0U4N7_9AGAM|nr:hypothetical protein F5148DRAFT_1150354 [Russula earlei]
MSMGRAGVQVRSESQLGRFVLDEMNITSIIGHPRRSGEIFGTTFSRPKCHQIRRKQRESPFALRQFRTQRCARSFLPSLHFRSCVFRANTFLPPTTEPTSAPFLRLRSITDGMNVVGVENRADDRVVMGICQRKTSSSFDRSSATLHLLRASEQELQRKKKKKTRQASSTVAADSIVMTSWPLLDVPGPGFGAALQPYTSTSTYRSSGSVRTSDGRMPLDGEEMFVAQFDRSNFLSCLYWAFEPTRSADLTWRHISPSLCGCQVPNSEFFVLVYRGPSLNRVTLTVRLVSGFSLSVFTATSGCEVQRLATLNQPQRSGAMRWIRSSINRSGGTTEIKARGHGRSEAAFFPFEDSHPLTSLESHSVVTSRAALTTRLPNGLALAGSINRITPIVLQGGDQTWHALSETPRFYRSGLGFGHAKLITDRSRSLKTGPCLFAVRQTNHRHSVPGRLRDSMCVEPRAAKRMGHMSVWLVWIAES